MQQRKSVLGRPLGTDGSDFSYRMVIDARYTKVAQEKSRLQKLLIIQAVIQLIGVLSIFVFLSKEWASDGFTISSISIGFISLLIGELGRRHSRANFLRLYIVSSSFATLLSAVCIVRSINPLQVIQNSSDWTSKKFELIELGHILLGMLVEIFAITTTVSLIQNMAPPKRAS